MMRLQQNQSFTSRLQLIERRLDAAASDAKHTVGVASDAQHKAFVDCIEPFFLAKNPLFDGVEYCPFIQWKLIKNTSRVAISMYTILAIWGDLEVKLARVDFDSELLKLRAAFGLFTFTERWQCKMSILADPTKQTAIRASLTKFLIQCQTSQNLYQKNANR